MPKAAEKNITTADECPALAMARLIDVGSRLHDEFDHDVIFSKDQVEEKLSYRSAMDQAYHYSQTRLQALALTRAESLEGAIAKAFIAFGILKCEFDAPHENEWQGKHMLFVARELMADARRVMEQSVGPVVELGTRHWYSQGLEPQSIIERAQSIEKAKRPQAG